MKKKETTNLKILKLESLRKTDSDSVAMSSGGGDGDDGGKTFHTLANAAVIDPGTNGSASFFSSKDPLGLGLDSKTDADDFVLLDPSATVALESAAGDDDDDGVVIKFEFKIIEEAKEGRNTAKGQRKEKKKPKILKELSRYNLGKRDELASSSQLEQQMECEWDGCRDSFDRLEDFTAHVGSHAEEADVRLAEMSASKESGITGIQCCHCCW